MSINDDKMDLPDVQVSIAFLSELIEGLGLLASVAPDITHRGAEIADLASAEIVSYLEKQKLAEQRFHSAIEARRSAPTRVAAAEAQRRVDAATLELKNISVQLTAALRENPMLSQNLQRAQGFRDSVTSVATRARTSLATSATASEVLASIRAEQSQAKEHNELLAREAAAAVKLRTLADDAAAAAAAHAAALASSSEHVAALRTSLAEVSVEANKAGALAAGRLVGTADAVERAKRARVRELQLELQMLEREAQEDEIVINDMKDVLTEEQKEIVGRIASLAERKTAAVAKLSADFAEAAAAAAAAAAALAAEKEATLADDKTREARQNVENFENLMFERITQARDARLKYVLADMVADWRVAYEIVAPQIAQEKRQSSTRKR